MIYLWHEILESTGQLFYAFNLFSWLGYSQTHKELKRRLQFVKFDQYPAEASGLKPSGSGM